MIGVDTIECSGSLNLLRLLAVRGNATGQVEVQRAQLESLDVFNKVSSVPPMIISGTP